MDIKKIMEENGWSVDHVAEICGVLPPTVYGWRAGKNIPGSAQKHINLKIKSAKKNEVKLDNYGKWFVKNAKTVFGSPLLPDWLELLKNNNAALHDDLTNPVVRLRSKISLEERMKLFGSPDTPKQFYSGERGPEGYPIPSEEYLIKIRNSYGQYKETRVISLKPTRGFDRENKMIEQINKVGLEITEMLEKAFFEIV
ncbi:MAG: helix-turn-helix transcriptional regulator [Desulforegulaceae bacterium]|nr:helix-turn-helix transcriptional regulator [Desulforegulaceae bacterium]